MNNLIFFVLELHNALLRESLKKHRGFEVKFEGHGFLMAFSSLDDALQWQVNVQLQLLQISWPKKLSEHSGYIHH